MSLEFGNKKEILTSPTLKEYKIPSEGNRGSDCVPMVLSMIVGFDSGKLISIEDIESKIEKERNRPTFVRQLSEYLFESGYLVDAYTNVDFNTIVNNPDDTSNWDVYIQDILKNAPQISKKELLKDAKYIVENLRIHKDVTESEIEELLSDDSNHIIGFVNGGRHVILVTGIKDGMIYFVDPSKEVEIKRLSLGDFINKTDGNILSARKSI